MTPRIARCASATLLAFAVAACGALQSAKDGTADAARAVFVSKVKQMNLEITARGALNQDVHGTSLPVVLRVYQLKDDKPFTTATYMELLDGTGALKAATVSSHDVTLGPGQTVKLSAPISDDAQYVGIAAFFQNTGNAEWSVLVPKSQWKKTDPVKIEVVGRTVGLESEKP